jgi:ornithine cyclodeaminase/alanine dehydrogenase-like protein (mu-crystallin family)
MLILNAEDIRQALPMRAAIEAMKEAFAALSSGRAEVPLRARLPVKPHEGTSLFMPAYLQSDQGESLAIKIVSIFPKNIIQGLPMIHAAVVVLDAATGRVLAVLEGGTLTAIRTGAGCGAATDLLARPDSSVAAIFGAGVQARTQLEAVCAVRTIERAYIYAPTSSNVEALIEEMAGVGQIPTDLRAAASPAEAIAEADVISAATTSFTPVFTHADLKPGTHINGAGSYTPEMQEIPAETIMAALVTVDSRSASLAEAGDLIQPIQQGIINEDHIHAEIGEVVLEQKSGRTSVEEITFFKSVGVAVQDAAAGSLALKNAAKMGLGQEVDW